jgi:hypothetical protein
MAFGSISHILNTIVNRIAPIFISKLHSVFARLKPFKKILNSQSILQPMNHPSNEKNTSSKDLTSNVIVVPANGNNGQK